MMWVQRVLWEVWGGYLSFPFIEFSDLSEFGRGDLKIAIDIYNLGVGGTGEEKWTSFLKNKIKLVMLL